MHGLLLQAAWLLGAQDLQPWNRHLAPQRDEAQQVKGRGGVLAQLLSLLPLHLQPQLPVARWILCVCQLSLILSRACQSLRQAQTLRPSCQVSAQAWSALLHQLASLLYDCLEAAGKQGSLAVSSGLDPLQMRHRAVGLWSCNPSTCA